eukprot:CAMPEP_0114484414 /NCGR_PEP_ID=MMETSP0104-20121206/19402_1 /TAXON_ID=37642 ORGANISM="Paraphysomonas imperforata, Strain PA2" /NCGR_SAMPLE_ID=MMETSP0104 /ASSEMBLY_ACC=CAM_ASM_000202 /LENGTH=166 /DNA_ID=CAMNT_0001660463 /DNA_START=199 /DNA_END=699 /DNA_ORIENTATION=-
MTGVDSFLFVLFVLSCVNKTFGQANTAIGGQVKGHRVSHSFGLRSTPHTSSDSYQVSPLKDVMSNESTEHKHELFCRKMVEEHSRMPWRREAPTSASLLMPRNHRFLNSSVRPQVMVATASISGARSSIGNVVDSKGSGIVVDYMETQCCRLADYVHSSTLIISHV